jgi:hypothetical protein
MAPPTARILSRERIELLLDVEAQQCPDAAPDRPAKATELVSLPLIGLGQRHSNHRLLDQAGEIGIDLF